MAKQVPDTGETRTLDAETGLLDRAATETLPDEITERALELALRAKDADGSTEIVVLTVGPDGTQTTLRKMLSMGADRAMHIADDSLAGADMLQTAKVLGAALKHEGFDIVLAGNQSTDGRGGMVPAMIAEMLDVPLLSDLSSFGVEGTQVTGTMRTDTSEIELTADWPAVVAVTEGVVEARFPSFKGIMAAKKKPTAKLSLSDLGIQAGPAYAPVRSVMVSAAGAPPKQTGPKFVDDGSAAAKLVDFLESRHLI